MEFIDSTVFQWVLLPLFIFCARVADVSMDTVRIMLLSRGKRIIPPLLGFVQVMIWLLAIRQIFMNLSNVACFFAYAGGFSMGTYVGMILEEKLAVGIQVIRVITRQDGAELIDRLKQDGYGVTTLNAQGTTGQVNVIFTIVDRRKIPQVINIVKQCHPRAFYTIEDVKSANEGVFPITHKGEINREHL